MKLVLSLTLPFEFEMHFINDFFIILNCTTAENYIDIRYKETFFEYDCRSINNVIIVKKLHN